MSSFTFRNELDTSKAGGVGHLAAKTKKEQEHMLEGLSTSLRILASSLREEKRNEKQSGYVGDNSVGNKNVSVSSNRRVPPIAIYKVAPNLDSIDLLSLQNSIIERLSSRLKSIKKKLKLFKLLFPSFSFDMGSFTFLTHLS